MHSRTWDVLATLLTTAMFPFNFFPCLISSHPECLHLISFISSKCSPSSTTLCTQEVLLRSKNTGARLSSSPFSPSSPYTWHTVPHHSGPRWSLHHGFWTPHHPTSHNTTKSTPHSPKTSTLTPISEGIRHHQWEVGLSKSHRWILCLKISTSKMVPAWF